MAKKSNPYKSAKRRKELDKKKKKEEKKQQRQERKTNVEEPDPEVVHPGQ